jgi:uncharacterized NAD(P)/FAD-binding protein YdhS
VVLIERTGDFGPGIAYRTTDARHRLNVPAGRMSAFPDQPDDFVAWAEVDPAAFVSRRRYGAYLRTLLAEAEAASAGRLERVTGEVVRLRRAAGRIALDFRDGRELGCDRVVLALGWPHGSPACELPADPRVYEDPWAPGALEAERTTVVVGTGPTAVDVALSLCGRSRSARVVLVSRSGRLPFAHRPGLRPPAPPPSLPAGEVRLARLESRVRAHVARMVGDGYDWRDAVDGLRPVVPQLWRRLPLDDRREFVRARARAWEVRRHRLAPQVAGTIAALRLAERLAVAAGGVVATRPRRDGIELHCGDGTQVHANRVIACTGAGAPVGRCDDRLVGQLVDDGIAAPDDLSLGLRARADGALLNACGAAHDDVWLLGPLRRGELWESTAVRELRAQAAEVAAAVGRSFVAGRPRELAA